MPRAFVLVVLFGLAVPPAAAQTRLLRFPDLHQDTVVFCHAGDLWSVSAQGGLAARLTAHPGLELFPKFSPDGQWIAFTGQYDGDEQVYVIPVQGGVPRRLTNYPARGPLPPRWGYDNQVYGWTPDGRVLFRSMRDGFDLTDTRLYTVGMSGGSPEVLPMPVSGGGDLSPDGERAVYSPLTRDFRTWKRYQGGWAQDLYIFDLKSHDLTPITRHPRTDRDPMWIGQRICFASDRDGTLNIYSYDVTSGETVQLTHETVYDVRWPSKADDARIIHELNGGLRILDVASGSSRDLEVAVPNDGLATRPSRIEVGRQVSGFALSPGGERALLTAHGDVFTAPIEHGASRNLTRSSGVHEKSARWSPDGRWISYLSDRTGEEEIWLVAQDGKGEPRQLTKGGAVMRYTPTWAPDGAHLAFSDKDGRLYSVTVADGTIALIADDQGGLLSDYDWAPCGQHLAYTLSQPNGRRALHVFSLADGQSRQVTDGTFTVGSPTFSPDGNFLFVFSDREWAPQISADEWNYATNRTTGIFAYALRKDVKHPFAPRSDEVAIAEKKAEKPAEKHEDDSTKEKSEGPKKPTIIDFDGLAGRVVRVPIPSDNYNGLSAVEGRLFYVRSGPFYYGRESDRSSDLMVFSLENRKAEIFVGDAGGYAVSNDGKKILVRKDGGFHLFTTAGAGKDGKAVATSELVVDRVPADEWTQMFDEVWRRFRDFFYVPNMHGYDWNALRDQYRPLLAHVSHRSDLNYVLGEMIAELNVSHAYVSGGDYDTPERVEVALPGARFVLDAPSGRYRISRIFAGQNEEERYRSPLTEVGVNIAVGDYVLAINGQDLVGSDDPYRLLRGQADHQVTFLVNGEPKIEGAREVSFRPLTSETELLYLNWVTVNRQRTLDLSGGRVGYLHVPDMGEDGIREFIKWFYPQIRMEGLVIDVRNNGGGNVSQMLIERLRRQLLATEFTRTSDRVDTYPSTVFHGHMVCILNENSASDGDIFPSMFRQAKLGPLVGKRSWGGIIGITNRGTLIDGGQVNVPEFGNASVTGEWVIEGHGVDPDIVVENDAKSLIDGRDPQLERAVAEVLARMQADPKRLPTRPADPVKTR